MNRLVLASAIAGILILGMIGFTQDIFAPAPQKPQKIRIDEVSWDKESQSFVVEMSMQFGISTASTQNEKFLVSTTLSFDANGVPVELFGEQLVEKIDGAQKDSDNMVSIKPVIISWDRIVDGKEFSGTVDMYTFADLFEFVWGKKYGFGDAESKEEIISSSGCTSDADCTDGNVCNGAETCNSSNECDSGVSLSCDDGNECTAESCDPLTGCNYSPVPDNTSCNKGAGACFEGKCFDLPQ